MFAQFDISHKSQFNVALCDVGGYPNTVFGMHCANESSITVQVCNHLRAIVYVVLHTDHSG